jgi:hypothetical protein
LRGMHRTGKDRIEKVISTSNLVQKLIRRATDNTNLVSSGFVGSDFLTYAGENKCILVGPRGIEALRSVLSHLSILR